MEKPNFLKPEIKGIEELEDEKSYFKNVKEIENQGKLIKEVNAFSTLDEAREYLRDRPQKENRLQSYLPATNYVIGESRDPKFPFSVYAIADKVDGRRLDKIDINRQETEFYSQLDDFIYESLLLFEETGRCPGIYHLPNFVLDNNGHLFYVDSEPYPIFPFDSSEMALFIKKKLEKKFGSNIQDVFPETWGWIQEHIEKNNYFP